MPVSFANHSIYFPPFFISFSGTVVLLFCSHLSSESAPQHITQTSHLHDWTQLSYVTHLSIFQLLTVPFLHTVQVQQYDIYCCIHYFATPYFVSWEHLPLHVYNSLLPTTLHQPSWAFASTSAAHQLTPHMPTSFPTPTSKVIGHPTPSYTNNYINTSNGSTLPALLFQPKTASNHFLTLTWYHHLLFLPTSSSFPFLFLFLSSGILSDCLGQP